MSDSPTGISDELYQCALFAVFVRRGLEIIAGLSSDTEANIVFDVEEFESLVMEELAYLLVNGKDKYIEHFSDDKSITIKLKER